MKKENVNKKETKIEETKLPHLEESQKNLINDFNKNFSKYATLSNLDESEKEDFKKKAKDDFENFGREIQGKTYEVANKKNAKFVAEFLQKWNKEMNRWEAQGWKGIIYFDEYITKKIQELNENKCEKLDFEQGPLLFLYGSMMKPQGTGLDSANKMKELEESFDNRDDKSTEIDLKHLDIDNVISYSTILEKIGRHIDYLKSANHEMEILQQRWAMAESDIKMDLKITELEEFVEFSNC